METPPKYIWAHESTIFPHWRWWASDPLSGGECYIREVDLVEAARTVLAARDREVAEKVRGFIGQKFSDLKWDLPEAFVRALDLEKLLGGDDE